jgi:hypothetical protein
VCGVPGELKVGLELGVWAAKEANTEDALCTFNIDKHF